jgi:hypothetical protein
MNKVKEIKGKENKIIHYVMSVVWLIVLGFIVYKALTDQK